MSTFLSPAFSSHPDQAITKLQCSQLDPNDYKKYRLIANNWKKGATSLELCKTSPETLQKIRDYIFASERVSEELWKSQPDTLNKPSWEFYACADQKNTTHGIMAIHIHAHSSLEIRYIALNPDNIRLSPENDIADSDQKIVKIFLEKAQQRAGMLNKSKIYCRPMQSSPPWPNNWGFSLQTSKHLGNKYVKLLPSHLASQPSPNPLTHLFLSIFDKTLKLLPSYANSTHAPKENPSPVAPDPEM
jgi:hypothetical protein